MTPFRKRTYTSFSQFVQDIRFLMANRKSIRRITQEKALSGTFRERLMLAVTQVNDCRYCTRAHTKAALMEGLSADEIGTILGGEFDGCPAGEIPAMLYAEHWAETEGRPDNEAHEKLIQTYGRETVADIDIVLRVIRTGNYSGNTLDYFLYRLSFGRLGFPKKAGA